MSPLRSLLAATAAMAAAVLLGYLAFPGEDDPLGRFLFHLAGFACSFPLHWLWLFLIRRNTDAALIAALAGPPLRIFGLLVLVGILYGIDRGQVWRGAVLYTLTVGTFLCFQVVTQALRKYPGGGL